MFRYIRSFLLGRPVANRIITILTVLAIPILLSSCTMHKASPDFWWGSVPNDEGVKMLAKMGVKTIVNFRTNSHKGRSKFANDLGLNFYHIQTGVFLTPEEPEIKRFLEIVGNPNNRPVYVACNIGIDRTSYYVAVYRMAIQGWTAKQATDEMLAHKVKQWWWTFKQYKDSLVANEARMREMAREMGIEKFSPPGSKVCTCLKLLDDDSHGQLQVHKMEPLASEHEVVENAH